MSPAAAVRVGAGVARRPRLWSVAVRQWRRTIPRRWWAHRPFLPMPSGDYLRFRLITQYGDATHRIESADVLNYLAWCKRHDAAG